MAEPVLTEAMFLIDSPFTPLVGALVGAVLLLAGRRVFWLLVAAVGFLLGVHLAQRWLGLDEIWLRLLVGALFGLVGAFLAVLLQRFAIAVVGFLLGGTAAGWVAETALSLPEGAAWIAFLVGGILAALVSGFLFEMALVVLSSLLGASLVVQALAGVPSLDLSTTGQVAAFVALTVLGLVAQALQPRRRVELERGERLRRQEERRRGG